MAIVLVLGSSCAEKMICPAYQSAFIYDTTALKKKFSYFVNDTPKIVEVNKTKFLLIEPVSYRKKLASFRTIEMLPIYPVIPDSLKFSGDNQMVAERDVQDSTGIAKEPLHPGLIGPKFNVEQENYMYYFRKNLVLPDVRAEASGMSSAKAKKVGFFKRLFKKDKEKAETTSGDEAEKKNFFQRIFNKKKSGAEADTTASVDQEPKEKKPNFFQKILEKFKKKPSAGAEKEEEKKKADNDGF